MKKTKLNMWILRVFHVISTEEAQAIGLRFGRNVYGDEINRLDCRSLWFDDKGRSYRVRELFYPDGIDNYFWEPGNIFNHKDDTKGCGWFVLAGIIIFILVMLAATGTFAQKVRQGSVITVTNWTWDCGGYSPQKAYVVKRKRKLYVKFDFEYGGTEKPQYMLIDSAFKYWKEEETKIVTIKY